MSEALIASGKVCRLCLTKEQDVYLGDKISKGLKFWQVFTSITNIRYSPHDGLPQSICRMCAAQLTNIQVFRERCETSNETLLGTLAQTSTNVDYLEGDDDVVLEEKYDPEITTIILQEDDSMISDNDVEYLVEEIKDEFEEPLQEDEEVDMGEEEAEEVEEQETSGKKYRAKKYRCKQCGVHVESPSKLMRHLRTHVLEDQKVLHNSKIGKVFSCKSCGVAFLKSKHLRIHVLSGRCKGMPGAENLLLEEDRRRPGGTEGRTVVKCEDTEEFAEGYRCYVCDKLHESMDLLKNHLIEMHKKLGDPLFCCIRCDFTHEFPDDMIEHYRENKLCDDMARSGEKETHFTCEICDKHFRFRCDLKKHSICHTGEKGFECDICFKRFTRKGEVVIHKRQHFNIKPYMCQECGICFSRCNSLARHRLVHTGEAKWECDVCHRRFKWSSVLKVHRYSHTGEKPFKCKLCSKAYTSRSGLVKHRAKHPEIKDDVDVSD